MPWSEERRPSHTILKEEESGKLLMIDGTGKVWEMHENAPKGGYISGRRKLIGALEQGEFETLVSFGINHPFCESVITTIDNLVGLHSGKGESESLPTKYARFAGIVVRANSISVGESKNWAYTSSSSKITVETEDTKSVDMLRSYLGRLQHDLEVTMVGKLVKYPRTNLIFIEETDYGSYKIDFSSSGTKVIVGDAHLNPPPPLGISDEHPEGPRILDL